MFKSEITVCSHDNDLLDEIELLHVDGIEYGRPVFDDASSPEIITAYINIAASIITFLAAALPLISKRKEKNCKSAVVYIRTTETTNDLKELVSTYKEHIKIEIINQTSDK